MRCDGRDGDRMLHLFKSITAQVSFENRSVYQWGALPNPPLLWVPVVALHNGREVPGYHKTSICEFLYDYNTYIYSRTLS